MGAKRKKGESQDATVMDTTFTGTTAIVTSGDSMRDFDSVGAQLVVDFNSSSFTGSASDALVGGTKTWTLSEFTFTGLTGATIRVTGAANAGNNGDFVISSVTSAHVIVTTTATGLVNETFSTSLLVEVIRTDTAAVPAGTWKIEVSNDFVPNSNSNVYGQKTQAGTWTDITSAFSPTIAAVITAGSQYVQADLTARDIRWTFTPSAGQGKARVRRFCKSWS